MAVSARDHRLLNATARLLGQTLQGVEFPQKADYRLSAAVPANKGGVNAAKTAFHLKTMLLQCLAQSLCGLGLLHAGFGEVPNPAAQTPNRCLMALHPVCKPTIFRIHAATPFPKSDANGHCHSQQNGLKNKL